MTARVVWYCAGRFMFISKKEKYFGVLGFSLIQIETIN